jgi:hypothetical protein
MKKISKDTPIGEITLRKYEMPDNLSERDLVRKICLSLGLLQPGDSRDVIVDVLLVLLRSRRALNSKKIEELVIAERKKRKLPLLGIASSNIRRQLLRLRDIFIIEKVKNDYRIKERAKLTVIFHENIEKYFLDSIVKRVKEYLEAADKKFFDN